MNNTNNEQKKYQPSQNGYLGQEFCKAFVESNGKISEKQQKLLEEFGLVLSMMKYCDKKDIDRIVSYLSAVLIEKHECSLKELHDKLTSLKEVRT